MATFSFGAPAAKPATNFGGFGAPATSTPSSAPSLFGSSAPAPSLFGSSAPTTGGLFGGTSQPAPSGGLFGAPATSAPAPSGGLFGASAAPAAPSLFGTPAASAAPSSLFGASQPAPAGGLFGQQQPATGGSLFGGGVSQAGGSTSLFGQPQQQQQPPQPAVTSAPLFGQSQSAASASLFGSKPATSSLFGSTAPSYAPQQQQQQPQQPLRRLGDPLPLDPNEPSITSRLEGIKSAWDPNDPKCRFQTYFYNEPTPPHGVGAYGRPPQGTDEKAWTKAVKENPDPERLVPAIAIGFPAVQSRIDLQTRTAQIHQSTLSELHSHLSDLSTKHTLETSLRTLRASQQGTVLASRLLALVAKLSGLTTARNASIRGEEEELRIGLEGMGEEVEQVKGRTNELWSGVGGLKARLGARGGEGGGGERREWALVDEEGLKQVLEILSSQQAGLDHLTKTLNAAEGDVEVMKEAFGMTTTTTRGEGKGGRGEGVGRRGV